MKTLEENYYDVPLSNLLATLKPFVTNTKQIVGNTETAYKTQ